MAQHRSIDLPFTPLGSHAQDATISAATILAPETGATMLIIQATDQNVRFTLDGTAPTASKGFVLTAGDPALILPISPVTVIKVIEETATATVEYQWGVL